VLPRRQRVGADAEHPQQAGDVAVDLVRHDLGVLDVPRCGQRADDVQRHAGAGPRCVDGELGAGPQRADALGVHAPPGQALAPRGGLRRGEVRHGQARGGRVTLVDPRLEVARREGGEGQAQVGQVALGVDEQRGHTCGEALLDEHHPEAGLARPGHPDDDAMSGEVGCAQERGLLRALVRGRVDPAAEGEVRHDPDPSDAAGGTRARDAANAAAPSATDTVAP
jgi:hypothetical protein